MSKKTNLHSNLVELARINLQVVSSREYLNKLNNLQPCAAELLQI
jgi:hypothetical protein